MNRISYYGRSTEPRSHRSKDGFYLRIVVSVFCAKGSSAEVQGIRDRLVGKEVVIRHQARQGRCVGKTAMGDVARVSVAGRNAVRIVVDCYTPVSTDCFVFDRGVTVELLPQVG